MPQSLPDRTAGRPLSIRANGFTGRERRGEAPGTKGADDQLLREFGRVIGRAMQLSGIDQKEMAFRLGHADHTRVSKWVAGIENPQIAKLLAVEGFRLAFMVALAEQTNGGVRVETTLTFERIRA